MVARKTANDRRSMGFIALFLLLTLVFTGAAAGTAKAEEPLEVSVDQTSIHENGTLTLTVEGQIELELSLSGLLNLRTTSLPEPDLGELRDSFDILDQRQSYSIRSINGENSAEVTWTYQLAPRRTGDLSIPSLTLQGAQSQPVTIKVEPGNSPEAGGPSRDAWVEADMSKEQAFVREKLVYTLKLFYRGSLVGGDLTEPQLENAIIEPLGEQTRSTEFINNQRYQVVERRYLVYPQRSGTLNLPSQEFTGRQRVPATGALRFLRARSEPVTVDILPPPDDFPGDRWIAAESLVLDEEWSRSPENLEVGDSLTRVLTLRTLGLLESALPLISVDYPPQFNAYPEGPSSEAEINSGTVEATQVQTTALVAVQPGTLTLPEIRLHWWDTLNDQAGVAVIPVRTLTVQPAQVANNGTRSPLPAANGGAEDSAAAGNDGSEKTTEGDNAATEPSGNPFIPWLAGGLAVFFALAWLLTLILWWRRRAAASADTPDEIASTGIDLNRLKQHAISGHTETLHEIPAWVRTAFNRPDIHTLKATRAFFADPALNQALDALEQYHFGGGSSHAQWKEGKALAAALERLNRTRRPNGSASKALPPFRKVPDQESAR